TTLGGHPFAEREIVTPGLEALLSDRFRPISRKARRSYAMGAVQAIAATPDGWVGAADPRREGTAGGF
ncbi:MAG: gamma-glutamyltransferase, partial [Candidatus Eisenbacteria bacterium]|nr:gamma-glutamyltransferase [Candidatus Eisenbacteria bacterium]